MGARRDRQAGRPHRPAGNRVSARIPIGGEFSPNAIAAGKEGVFVASGPSLIVRIDPATNRVSQREDSEGAYDLATGAGFLWGTNFLDGDVKRVTPAGMAVTTVTSGLGKEPRFVSVDQSGVWVLNSDGTMTRLTQPSGGAPPSARKFRTQTTEFPGGLAVGEGGVWVTEGSTLWRYDPASGRLAQTIDLGSLVANGIATGGGAVWLTNFSKGQVVRVDAATRRVSQPVTVPGDKASRIAVGP